MKLSHLALTVIEDPDHAGSYHWLLLEHTGQDVNQLLEFAASEERFDSASAAFDAGTVRWRLEMTSEDEDGDPVGDGSIEPE